MHHDTDHLQQRCLACHTKQPDVNPVPRQKLGRVAGGGMTGEVEPRPGHVDPVARAAAPPPPAAATAPPAPVRGPVVRRRGPPATRAPRRRAWTSPVRPGAARPSRSARRCRSRRRPGPAGWPPPPAAPARRSPPAHCPRYAPLMERRRGWYVAALLIGSGRAAVWSWPRPCAGSRASGTTTARPVGPGRSAASTTWCRSSHGRPCRPRPCWPGSGCCWLRPPGR